MTDRFHRRYDAAVSVNKNRAKLKWSIDLFGHLGRPASWKLAELLVRPWLSRDNEGAEIQVVVCLTDLKISRRLRN